MSTKKNTARGGVSVGTVLLILFVTLKLLELIDWPWWIVLSPLWAGLALVALLVVGGLTLVAIASGIVEWDRSLKRARARRRWR